MKALKHHLILYDANCPVCTFYTKVFTSSGMLEEEGRSAYQDISASTCQMVDVQRAVNEIALVDTQTGEVTYGIRSLFKVFAHSFPIFRRLFLFPPFVFVMSQLYAFISYNRRVILPPANEDTSSIQPAFRLPYRIAYLLLACLAVGYVLTAYNGLLRGIVPLGNSCREYLICSGQLVFQGCIVWLYKPERKWEYLGNMMTISLAGSMLLLPLLLVSAFFSLSSSIASIYFLGVAGLMFVEHIRRTKLLGLGWILSLTWVLYRILVLAGVLWMGWL